MAAGPSTWYSWVVEATAVGIFAGGGDGEFAFGLEEFQGVAGSLGAFFFGDGKDLVFEVGLSHVEERLTRHGRVLDPVFRRDEGEHGVHQGRLAGGRGGLDHDAEGLGEFPRHCRQIRHELVGVLADQAAC